MFWTRVVQIVLFSGVLWGVALTVKVFIDDRKLKQYGDNI